MNNENEDETITNESQEQAEQPEVPINLESFVEAKQDEVKKIEANIEETGKSEVESIKNVRGSTEQIEKMEEAIKGTAEGIEGAEKTLDSELEQISEEKVDKSPNLSFEDIEQQITDMNRAKGKNIPETNREFFQNIKVGYLNDINKILESNKSFSEKKIALNELKNSLELEAEMIDDSLLEEGKAQKMWDDLGSEITKAVTSVEDLERKSKFTKENLIKNIDKIKSNLEIIMGSKETDFGKESGVRGISNHFNMVVKAYGDVINNSEELNQTIASTRKVLDDALLKLKEK